MPIHQGLPGQAVEIFQDPTGGTPPTPPTIQQIAEFRAAMVDELAKATTHVSKETSEVRRRVLRQMLQQAAMMQTVPQANVVTTPDGVSDVVKVGGVKHALTLEAERAALAFQVAPLLPSALAQDVPVEAISDAKSPIGAGLGGGNRPSHPDLEAMAGRPSAPPVEADMDNVAMAAGGLRVPGLSLPLPGADLTLLNGVLPLLSELRMQAPTQAGAEHGFADLTRKQESPGAMGRPEAPEKNLPQAFSVPDFQSSRNTKIKPFFVTPGIEIFPLAEGLPFIPAGPVKPGSMLPMSGAAPTAAAIPVTGAVRGSATGGVPVSVPVDLPRALAAEAFAAPPYESRSAVAGEAPVAAAGEPRSAGNIGEVPAIAPIELSPAATIDEAAAATPLEIRPTEATNDADDTVTFAIRTQAAEAELAPIEDAIPSLPPLQIAPTAAESLSKSSPSDTALPEVPVEAGTPGERILSTPMALATAHNDTVLTEADGLAIIQLEPSRETLSTVQNAVFAAGLPVNPVPQVGPTEAEPKIPIIASLSDLRPEARPEAGSQSGSESGSESGLESGSGTGMALGAGDGQGESAPWERDESALRIRKRDIMRASEIEQQNEAVAAGRIAPMQYIDFNRLAPEAAADQALPEAKAFSEEWLAMLVDRFLVTADPGAYVKEVRMTMNQSVLPNTEIRFRQIGNQLLVTLVSEDGATADLLREEGPLLAEALRSGTGNDVELHLIVGVGPDAREETL